MDPTKIDALKEGSRDHPHRFATCKFSVSRTRGAPWRDAWERFIPFLEFPPEVRKILYTTNASESLNYQLRKIIKNRGHFPNDDAVIKLLWLAIRDIEDKRAREHAGRPAQESA